MRRRPLLACALAVAAVSAGVANAATTTCNVAASGGFANCLTVTAPTFEQAKAPNSSATPYRFQLTRFSDGARWGWWEWNDTNHHTVLLSLSGAITGQVDNLDTGTQGYTVTLSP
ncbi:MAG: hypothetical protein JHC74_11450 [Thermoleophilia bacterium]|nr:hypothetical protein [Thermoleophilia bacterium]